MRPLIALLMFVPALAASQPPTTSAPPAPRMVDSPWGDFPLDRLQPGARVRLTYPDGERTVASVLAVGDSALELRPAGSAAPTSLSMAALRSLRAFEVRAQPRDHERFATVGLIAGAAIGTLVGFAIHNSRDDSADERRPSAGDDIGSSAALGGFLGWSVGFYVLGRSRWRPVTLP